jgi:hypothetical protein
VKLVAEEGRLRVVYSLSYGPMGAAQERQRMDENEDGRLTAAETSAAARALGARLSDGAKLTVDGEPVELHWDAPFVAPAAGPIDTSPLTIELSASVDLPGGESHVRFVDLPSLPNVERSDYAFEAREPAELLASGSGDAPAARERLVSFLDRRASGPRVVALHVRLPGGGMPRLAWIVLGVAIVGLVGGALIWRARVSGRRTGT